MRLDGRQAEEMFLTAAQSLLALVVLANRRFGLAEALLLLGLFVLQFAFPTPQIRMLLGCGYLRITGGYLLTRSFRRSLAELLRFGLRVGA